MPLNLNFAKYSVKTATFNIKLEIDGIVKTNPQSRYIVTATAIKGALRRAAKEYYTRQLSEKNIEVPVVVRDVNRILEPPTFTEDPLKFFELSALPLNRLFGSPTLNTKTLKEKGIPENLIPAALMLSGRGVFTIVSPVIQVSVVHGSSMRDDIDQSSVAYPHQLNIATLRTLEFTVKIMPAVINSIKIPELRYNIHPQKAYYEAFVDIITKSIEIANELSISPFGGRSYHTVSWKIENWEEKTVEMYGIENLEEMVRNLFGYLRNPQQNQNQNHQYRQYRQYRGNPRFY